MAQEASRLAIMSLDIVRTTPRGQRDQPTSSASNEDRRRLFHSLISRHGGSELKAGPDAFLVEFPDALAAAKCAVEVQKLINEYNSSAPPRLRLKVRIGIHVRELVEWRGSASGEGST